MKLPVLFIFFLLIGLTGFSQTIVIKDLTSLSDQLTYQRSRGETNYNDIEGTPFLNRQFIIGEVIVNDSIHYENVPLRYNIYSDNIEFMNDQKQVLEINNSQSKYQFKFDNHQFTVRDYLNYGKTAHGILERLVDGKIQLYKKYQVDFALATKAIGFKDAVPNRFVRKDDTYLISAEKELPSAIGSKKALFEKLKSFKSDIEKYAKSRKLNPKKEEDLIQLIQYCNNE
ncbi:MAG TPA: hypothetical protein VKA27_18855 [Sunxiuqinia sp.]|nr:hypothetical protein [Sunxiuqinia sp.]